MPARLIRSTRLYPGAPYAYAADADAAGLFFTAGACPLDEHGIARPEAPVMALQNRM